MEGVLLSLKYFKNPSHNVNRLVSGPFSTKAELGRANFVVKIVRKTLLDQRGKNLIH